MQPGCSGSGDSSYGSCSGGNGNGSIRHCMGMARMPKVAMSVMGEIAVVVAVVAGTSR